MERNSFPKGLRTGDCASVKAPVGVMAWVGADSEVAEKVSQPRCPVGSLDAVVLVCKLLVIKAKLVHEGGRHLLDLVLRESLGETMSQGRLSLQEPPILPTRGACSCVAGHISTAPLNV